MRAKLTRAGTNPAGGESEGTGVGGARPVREVAAASLFTGVAGLRVATESTGALLGSKLIAKQAGIGTHGIPRASLTGRSFRLVRVRIG